MADIDLVGPCGIYCGSCRHFLLLKKDLLEKRGLKKGCTGCRIRNKNCAFIRRDCPPLRKNEYTFCYECKDFPCQNLIKLDNRHKRNYGDTPIKNLRKIQDIDVKKWVEEQKNYTHVQNVVVKSVYTMKKAMIVDIIAIHIKIKTSTVYVLEFTPHVGFIF